MTDTELKSCIGTIEMLRRLAYNIHGVMDVIDAGNCEKIIKVLSDIPKYKDAYGKGWDDGAKATYEHLKMCEEEQEPETGHWSFTTHYARRYRICPFCNVEREDDRFTGWNFCPNCGARMVGDKE